MDGYGWVWMAWIGLDLDMDMAWSWSAEAWRAGYRAIGVDSIDSATSLGRDSLGSCSAQRVLVFFLVLNYVT